MQPQEHGPFMSRPLLGNENRGAEFPRRSQSPPQHGLPYLPDPLPEPRSYDPSSTQIPNPPCSTPYILWSQPAVGGCIHQQVVRYRFSISTYSSVLLKAYFYPPQCIFKLWADLPARSGSRPPASGAGSGFQRPSTGAYPSQPHFSTAK